MRPSSSRVGGRCHVRVKARLEIAATCPDVMTILPGASPPAGGEEKPRLYGHEDYGPQQDEIRRTARGEVFSSAFVERIIFRRHVPDRRDTRALRVTVDSARPGSGLLSKYCVAQTIQARSGNLDHPARHRKRTGWDRSPGLSRRWRARYAPIVLVQVAFAHIHGVADRGVLTRPSASNLTPAGYRHVINPLLHLAGRDRASP